MQAITDGALQGAIALALQATQPPAAGALQEGGRASGEQGQEQGHAHPQASDAEQAAWRPIWLMPASWARASTSRHWRRRGRVRRRSRGGAMGRSGERPSPSRMAWELMLAGGPVSGRGLRGCAGAGGDSLWRARSDLEQAVWGSSSREAKVTLRPLARRCGPLSANQVFLLRALPLVQLEALAEALLDFEGMADLNAWLAANA